MCVAMDETDDPNFEVFSRFFIVVFLAVLGFCATRLRPDDSASPFVAVFGFDNLSVGVVALMPEGWREN
jgi:hypothetical protein